MGDWHANLAGPHGLLLHHARQSNEQDLIDCLRGCIWLHLAVLERYELAMGTVVRMEVHVASRSISPQWGSGPVSSGSPHVRPMGVHRTCGEPNKIKKNTHPKGITALSREQVQLVITMFHRQEGGKKKEGARGDAAVTATTYNRGDCLAWAYQHDHGHDHGHGHGREHEGQREHHEHVDQDRHGGLTALSTPVGGLTINGSTHTLHAGARVTQTCDGHHEKVSLDDQEGFERHVHGADLGTADYVELLGHASAWVGGGDDVTIVAAKLMPMPGR